MWEKPVSVEQKKAHSEYNSKWKAKHRKENTAIASKIRDRARESARLKASRQKGDDGYIRLWIASTKSRAKKRGIPFSITAADISIPMVCPVLRIALVSGQGRFADSSPSIDRIVPELGYVKGNVVVMSYRANRIKYNATAAELRLIAAWMEAHVST